MSVYISNLPLYTGNTYNGYIIWNDSGETTTYKTLFQPQLIAGTGAGETYRTPTATASGTDSIAIGNGTSATGNYSVCIGGIGSTASGTYSSAFGNTNSASGFGAFALGGQNNNVGGFLNAAGGSSNTNNGEFTFIYGSSNNFNNTSVGCAIGATSCTAADYPLGITSNTIIGSTSCAVNYVRQSGIYSSANSSILGTDGSNRVYQSTILGGSGNTINANVYQSSIIGGSDNTISGGTFISMIGTSGRTGTASATTYVENLHTYRTPSTQVQPVSSGTTFTCNLDNGAKSQFYLTGTSTINITNVRDGASFIIKTQTTGNYNITWTATGYTFVFEGGIHDPGNATTDLFVFEVFGSVIYGNRRHNYS